MNRLACHSRALIRTLRSGNRERIQGRHYVGLAQAKGKMIGRRTNDAWQAARGQTRREIFGPRWATRLVSCWTPYMRLDPVV